MACFFYSFLQKCPWPCIKEYDFTIKLKTTWISAPFQASAAVSMTLSLFCDVTQLASLQCVTFQRSKNCKSRPVYPTFEQRTTSLRSESIFRNWKPFKLFLSHKLNGVNPPRVIWTQRTALCQFPSLLVHCIRFFHLHLQSVSSERKPLCLPPCGGRDPSNTAFESIKVSYPKRF